MLTASTGQGKLQTNLIFMWASLCHVLEQWAGAGVIGAIFSSYSVLDTNASTLAQG